MIHSICHSSEDLCFPAVDSPSIPPELMSDCSSEDGSEPATPVSLKGISKLPGGNVQSLQPFWRAPVDTKTTLESPFKNDRVCWTDCKPRDLPAIEHVLSDSDAVSDRGRGRIRRYQNGCSGKRGSKSPVSPDRFIPLRGFEDPPSTPFRVCKSPQRLSPDEKLLRRCLPSTGPFLPAHQRRTNTVPKPRIHSPHYGPHLVNDSAVTGSPNSQESGNAARQASLGAVWNVGGASIALAKPSLAISDGAGGLLSSGTTAPMHTAKFFPRRAEPEKHESRIALALDIDPASRLLNTCNLSPSSESTPSPSSPDYERCCPFAWKDSAWKRVEGEEWPKAVPKNNNEKVVPTQPFRVLDAPFLRDDFYCSILAYSSTSGYLAVGLGHRVYLWGEVTGVQHPPLREQHHSSYITSLSFSSDNGGKSILAIGRQTGMLSLWSTFDTSVRFEISHPSSITCVVFKPFKSRGPSKRFPDLEVDIENIVVGDDRGNVWYYSVEWPDKDFQHRFDWSGAMTLLAKISAHSQRVCGLAWSPDDTYLATGGNDNSCLLFDLREIIPSHEIRHVSRSSCPSPQPQNTRCQSALSCLTGTPGSERSFNGGNLISHLIPSWAHPPVKPLSVSLLNDTGTLAFGDDQTAVVPSNRQKHRLIHSSAVKAIAFAPWQPSLLATGGGTNDRAIHFFHTPSGSCLATIKVYAQVTSLIWSKTRREIAATFGFSQPEHPVRIAVFAWPSCGQVAAIPWGPDGSSWDGLADNDFVDCGRALCAVSYPGRPEPLVSQGRCPFEASSAMTSGRLDEREGLAAIQPKAKEGGLWCSRTMEEGCIIVASSDQTVKFHEVWSEAGRKMAAAAANAGPFGGSRILEGLEGIETPGSEIIR